jgi:hypothetical protein
MGSWGYEVFSNDTNLDFYDDVEKRIKKGMSVRKACNYLSKSDRYSSDSQDELTMSTMYIFKENNVKLTKFELMQLKVSIFHLLKRINEWNEPKLRKEYLLKAAEEFNIGFRKQR